MRVVFAAGPLTPGRLRAAAALAAAPGPADEVRMLPADAPDPGPTDGPEPPVLEYDNYWTDEGKPDLMAVELEIGRLAADRPPAIAIHAANLAVVGRDPHGGGVGEIVSAAGRALFWAADPPAVLHFGPAPLAPYYLREWCRLLTGGPPEPPIPNGPWPSPVGRPERLAEAVGRLAAAAEARKATVRPWVRLKGRIKARLGLT